jgi:hypothetical protein
MNLKQCIAILSFLALAVVFHRQAGAQATQEPLGGQPAVANAREWVSACSSFPSRAPMPRLKGDQASSTRTPANGT